MIEKFLKQTQFTSQEDYEKNLEFIIPEHFNFAYDVMDEWAKEKPEKLALLWTNDEGDCIRFSFNDIKEQSDRAAAYFMQLGIGKGDMVMLILKRRYEFWISMLALHKIGAVAIPATHMLTTHDIVYRNNRASVKAIICAGEEYIMQQVEGSKAESPTLKTLVSIGPKQAEGFHDWHKEWNDAPAFVRPTEKNDNDDTMLMYFTSGTSGEPKMVAHDFLYALGHLTTGVYWHNLGEDSIHLTVADTGWGKAVWGKMYGQWFAGAAVFVFDHEKFTADKILRQIEKYRITSFCAPPTVYRFLIHEDFSHYDLSSLRYCCTAGEALNPAVFDKFKELTGISLMEGFGQTETTLSVANLIGEPHKLGSMGRPTPLYDIRLLDQDGKEVGVGENGEICIKLGDEKICGLFDGYYGDEEKTKEVMHDGFYHTGDVAWRDEDGFLWYVSRVDDVIKSSGYRIGPFEIESVIMELPYVLECGVSAAPDPIRGQVVKASIVLTKGTEGTEELKKEIQNYVKHKTAPYKYPRIVVFRDELPKTISGKIQRNKL